MAVSTNFTSDVTSGLPGFTVSFTDTSTGSPNSWLWDFGDGEFSTDQNPQHYYTGSVGDKFTVVLRSWINSSTSTYNITNSDNTKNWWRDEGGSDPASAYSSWIFTIENYGFINPYPIGGPNYSLRRINSSSYLYKGSYTKFSWSTVASPTLTILQARISPIGPVTSPGVTLEDFGTFDDYSGNWFTIAVLNPSTTYTDKTFTPASWPQLPTPPTNGTQWGMGAGLRRVAYTPASEEDIDSSSKTDYINLIDSSSFDFVGSPLSGFSPLGVTFTDLSVHIKQIVSWNWNFGDGNVIVGSTNGSVVYNLYNSNT